MKIKFFSFSTIYIVEVNEKILNLLCFVSPFDWSSVFYIVKSINKIKYPFQFVSSISYWKVSTFNRL